MPEPEPERSPVVSQPQLPPRDSDRMLFDEKDVQASQKRQGSLNSRERIGCEQKLSYTRAESHGSTVLCNSTSPYRPY